MHFAATDGVLSCSAEPGLCVIRYRGPGTEAHALAMHPVWDAPVLGPRFVQLLVISPRNARDVPDAAFRAEVVRMMKAKGPTLVASVAVVATDVLLASVVRGVITGINWWTGDRFRLFDSLDAGIAFRAAAARDADIDVDAAQMRAALHALG
jgi:hypothetical protein